MVRGPGLPGNRPSESSCSSQRKGPGRAYHESVSALIRPGPATITIVREDRIVVYEPDGRIVGDAAQGFFAADTRLLSGWDLRVNGVRPVGLAASALSLHAARSELTNPPLVDPEGAIDAQQLSIRLDRTVGAGVHEDIDLVSFAPRPIRLTIELVLESDFADIFEVRGGQRVERTLASSRWDPGRSELRARYRNGSFRRELLVTLERATGDPRYRDGRLIFEEELQPRGRWHTCLIWSAGTGGRARRTQTPCLADELVGVSQDPARPTVEASDTGLERAWARAVADLDGLRLHARPDGRGPAAPAAGIPWFVTLFGRDSLIASLQALPVDPELLPGTLLRLAELQADADDPAREMEPGKILHEVRHDELTSLGRLPYGPLYATHDATSLFVIGLSEAFRWSGDRRLVERLLPHAEAAMSWIDRYGDRDGDGLQEYERRTPQGYPNQGWKDSPDAIVNADGSVAQPPIALVELQGYAYAAKLGLAELFEAVGRHEEAGDLRAAAARSATLIDERFWWEAEGTYYLGLDGAKRPIASVASNAGHLLWSGIVPAERAGRMVERLLAPDMWSGWGIRTMSADHLAFDPFSYHRGSVWPHDNALIAAGFRRYGYQAQAARVARGILDAAAGFADDRLPELFSGLDRQPGDFPVPYREANVPQAWAAGAVIQLVAIAAGLELRREQAGQRRFEAGPLPGWLSALTFRDLRLGRRTVDVSVGPDDGRS
jgi:glycogen debranching enzyme